jgi:hypothetical protein
VAAEAVLEREGYLSGEQLAYVLERTAGEPLSPVFGDYLLRFLRGEVKLKRGRKARSRVALDFDLGRASVLYYDELTRLQELVRQTKAAARVKRRRLPTDDDSDEDSIPIRAARFVLQTMKDEFPNISPQRLINMLSEQGWLRRPAKRAALKKRT